MTGDDASRLTPLPVRPRPRAGETAGSYVRRLALANHLRPSYLHGFLAGPPYYLNRIKPERLAALTGRTVADLGWALAGLTRQPRPQPSRRYIRAADKPSVFAVIRRDAQDGHSIRALAARHQLHRRTIRQALASPEPPPRKIPARTPARAMRQLREPVIAMLTAEPGMSVRQIWERLQDEHDIRVSYTTVRDYVPRLRPSPPGQRP